MNVPALAAWAPGGETHTIVGNGASRRLITMRRVWSSAPPGVFSVMTTASRAVAMRLRDPVLEVAGHDRVDDAARRQHRDPRRVVGGTRRGAGKHEHGAEDERDREQETTDVIDATGHRDLRRRHRTPARSRNSKQRRLQVSSLSATAATSCGSANEPVSLSVSRIVTGRPAASAT